MTMIFDPVLLDPQPTGRGGGSSYAVGTIGNMIYTAAQAGPDGNLISVSHDLAPPILATSAELNIAGMTYRAKTAGLDGNNISVAITQDYSGNAGTATLTRETTARFPASAITDAHFANVATLLFGAGVSGSTDIVDSSPANSVQTLYGNTSIQNASIYFDGNGDYLSVPSNDNFDFGMGEFTIEMWINPTHTSGTKELFGKRLNTIAGYSGYMWICATVIYVSANTYRLGIYATSNDANWTISNWLSPTFTGNGTFTHIALAQSGYEWSLYLNGTKNVITSAGGIDLKFDPLAGFTLGSYSMTSPASGYQGYINNVRVTKGVSRYTSSFTPPSLISANFNITEKDAYWGNPTTVKLVKADLAVPAEELPSSTADGDPYFNEVGLLLHGNGNNGADNATFVDSSSQAMPLARSGSATQGSFTPFSKQDGAWSTYFSGGANQIFSKSPATTWQITGDFTIEAWINPAAMSSNSTQTIVGINSLNINSLMLVAKGGPSTSSTSGFLQLWYNTGTWTSVQSSLAVPAQKWTHVAVTREGTTLRLFVNGVKNPTDFTVSGSFAYTGTNPYVGTNGLGGNTYTGHISGLHMVYGTALYTSDFTPPTSIQEVPGTRLLACVSNRAKDASSNAATVSVTGTTRALPFGPLVGDGIVPYSELGSVYLNGTSDYLSTPVTTSLDFGAGDFTIETWFYISGNSARGNDSLRHACLFSKWASSSVNNGYLLMVNGTSTTTGTGLQFSQYTNGTGYNVSYTGTIPQEMWHHAAVSRQGSNIRLFLNGALVASSSSWTEEVNGTGYTAKIGGLMLSGYNRLLNGYISGLRVNKGLATYNSPFTPATSAPEDLSGVTVLLPKFAGAAIQDSSKNFNISLVGGAQSSTAVSKFGSSSMKFDGIDSLLWVGETADPLLDIGTKDFTLDCWIYVDGSILSNYTIYSNYGTSTRSGAYALQLLAASSKLTFYVYPTGYVLTSSSTISVNEWHHIVLSRSSGKTKLYIDGILEASTTAAYQTLTSDPAHPAVIGAYWQFGTSSYAVGSYFKGYIDDFRLTIGRDRYASSGVSRSLLGTTETIFFPEGATVAELMSENGLGGTVRVSVATDIDYGSGISSSDPSPNNGVTTAGGVQTSSLSISVSGSDISVTLPLGVTTNSELKIALDADPTVSSLISVSDPTEAASAFPKAYLSGGTDASNGSLEVGVVGNNVSISIPEGTLSAELVSTLNAEPTFSSLVSASASDEGDVTTVGSVNLSGGA